MWVFKHISCGCCYIQKSSPTAEEETNTFGGFDASDIFLAKVLVVSMRLSLSFCKKPSFHLFTSTK